MNFYMILFVNELNASCIKSNEGQRAKRVRFSFYAVWARAWRKVDDEEKKQFVCSKEVLDLIRSILPKNVKGEIRKDAEIFH